MFDRLPVLAAEVTRVTLEVGSQGKCGGQDHIPDEIGESHVFFIDGPSLFYSHHHNRCLLW